MTALLADPIPALPVLPARPRAALGTNVRPLPGSAPWVACTERAELDAAGARLAVLDAPRYEWTARGLTVILAAVALVVFAMVTTLVTAFLAVSNEPLPTPGSPIAVAAVSVR